MELMIGFSKFGGHGSFDVFEDSGIGFLVEKSGSSGVDVSVGGEIDVFPFGSVNGVVNTKGKVEVVLEQIVGSSKGEVVVEGRGDRPIGGVKFPIEVLEKVECGFEWVVSVGFGVINEISKVGNEGFIMIVEEKIDSKGIEGGESDGREWVGFGGIGGQ